MTRSKSGFAAVSISQKAYASAETVIVANGLGFADALSAAPLGAKLDAPLLLTTTASVPDATLAEIKSLQPKRAVLLGGTGALGAGVEQGKGCP